jgi:hypothetical protein
VLLAAVASIAIGCGPTSVAADWVLDPAFPIEPETTELRLLAQQVDGGSAAGSPQDRLLPTEIAYNGDSIAITIKVESGHGLLYYGAFPVTVQLTEPVGGRKIVHGAGGERVEGFWSPPPT